MSNEEQNKNRKRTWNPIFKEWDYEDEQEDPPPEEVFHSPVVSKVWDPSFKDWIYTHADGSTSA